MKFEEFWASLVTNLKTNHDFVTLTQGKPFEARNAIAAIVITPESTGYKRVIKKDEFRKIWNMAKTFSDEQVYNTSNYQKDSVNISYIFTLIKHVIGDQKLE
jgi:hypothetical protein